MPTLEIWNCQNSFCFDQLLGLLCHIVGCVEFFMDPFDQLFGSTVRICTFSLLVAVRNFSLSCETISQSLHEGLLLITAFCIMVVILSTFCFNHFLDLFSFVFVIGVSPKVSKHIFINATDSEGWSSSPREVSTAGSLSDFSSSSGDSTRGKVSLS